MLLNYLVPEKVFVWVTAIATFGAIWTWVMILLAQLKFPKDAKGVGDVLRPYDLALVSGWYSSRLAASALYHCTSASAMAWEAARTGSAARLRWSQLALLHRVLPRDPLAPDALPADWTAA